MGCAILSAQSPYARMHACHANQRKCTKVFKFFDNVTDVLRLLNAVLFLLIAFSYFTVLEYLHDNLDIVR